MKNENGNENFKPRRGVMVSWKTVVPGNLKVGSKVELPTLTGMYFFVVTKIDGDILEAECGDLLCRGKREDGEWKFNHCIISKNITIPVSLVNKLPPAPLETNIGFTKTYK